VIRSFWEKLEAEEAGARTRPAAANVVQLMR
jgi:hypothetical protein